MTRRAGRGRHSALVGGLTLVLGTVVGLTPGATGSTAIAGAPVGRSQLPAPSVAVARIAPRQVARAVRPDACVAMRSSAGAPRIVVQVVAAPRVDVGQRAELAVRYRCEEAGRSLPIAGLRVTAVASPARILNLKSRSRVTGPDGLALYDGAARAAGRAVVRIEAALGQLCATSRHATPGDAAYGARGTHALGLGPCAVTVRMTALRTAAAAQRSMPARVAAPRAAVPAIAAHPLLRPSADAPSLAVPPDRCAFGPAGRGLDGAPACTQSVLTSIDAARAREGVGPMVLPTDWSALSPAEQLFVLADLERVDRGLPPYVGLAPELDAVALSAARSGSDPVWPSPLAASEASTWAGNEVSTLAAEYDWFYDDGYGSANVDCTAPGASGCWGHRDAILGAYTGLGCTDCVMGAATTAAPGSTWLTSLAEIVVAPARPGALAVGFTWARDVLPYLPAGSPAGSAVARAAAG